MDRKTKQPNHFRGYADVNPLSVLAYQLKVIRAPQLGSYIFARLGGAWSPSRR